MYESMNEFTMIKLISVFPVTFIFEHLVIPALYR